MEQMELIEALREKTGCSYSEARAAVAESGEDLLEALCWLEDHGKTQLVGAACSTSQREAPEPEPQPEREKRESAFSRGCKDLWHGICDLLRWANRTLLVVKNRDGGVELRIPLTAVVLLLIVCFWFVVAAVVLALFCGLRFSFEGPISDDLNAAMGKATDFVESVRDEIKDESFFRREHDREDGNQP